MGGTANGSWMGQGFYSINFKRITKLLWSILWSFCFAFKNIWVATCRRSLSDKKERLRYASFAISAFWEDSDSDPDIGNHQKNVAEKTEDNDEDDFDFDFYDW